MDKVKSVPTVARLLTSREGARARKIAALKAAYQSGELKVDEGEVARRMLEVAFGRAPGVMMPSHHDED